MNDNGNLGSKFRFNINPTLIRQSPLKDMYEVKSSISTLHNRFYRPDSPSPNSW